MPVDLAALLDPAHTAVVTSEMQQGIVTSASPVPLIADEVAAAGTIEACAELASEARAAGVRVVHTLIELRADRAGTAINNPMMGGMTKLPGHILIGTPAAALVPELGPEPEDLVSRRTHGLSPFIGTDLDPLLRNLGVTTIVPCGVSVNEALFGLCIEAANLGYRIVLPTDAVAGHPREYAADVIRYSLSNMANLSTVAEVVDRWRG